MKDCEQEVIDKYVKGNILDLGCAYGRCYNMLSKKGHYIGIDIRKDQINQAIYDYGPHFFVGDAMCLEFEDNTFDTIFCGFNVLDEIVDLSKALKEIIRTLKDDGVLIFSFHNPLNWKNFLRRRYTSWDNKRKVHMMTPRGIIKYMEDRGFKYISRYGSVFDVYPYYIFTVEK